MEDAKNDKILGKYYLGELYGKGSFGKIFWGINNEERVLIKQIKKDKTATTNKAQRKLKYLK